MTEMRILTVRQPWAWAIFHGKDVENRVRNIAGDFRGPIAIHAGKAVFEEEGGAYPEVQRAIWSEDEGYTPTDDQLWEVADDVDPDDPRFVYGAVLGVVDLADVHRAARHYEPIEGAPWVMECTDRPCCSPWGERETEHLVLENPRPLSEPIPFRGALGLRRLDDITTAQIITQIGA